MKPIKTRNERRAKILNNNSEKDIYNSIRKKIKEKKDEMGLSYSDLEAMTGISKSTLQRCVTGTTPRIPIDFLFKFEEVFKMERGSLSGHAANENKTKPLENDYNEKRNYPIYQTYAEYSGKSAPRAESGKKKAMSFKETPAASRFPRREYPRMTGYFSKPAFAEKPEYLRVAPGYEDEVDFCIIMDDDSMKDARILKGDIVFIKKDEPLKNGAIAAVSIFGSITVKYLYKTVNGIMLCSDNRNFDPIVINNPEEKEFHILGKAVYFQSKI